MQLFIVSKDPVVCARWLDDRRVNKIIIESAQMLSTAVRQHWASIDRTTSDTLCKSFNPRHPVTRWVTATRRNYLWTVEYHKALLAEKVRRTGKHHAHAARFNNGLFFASLAWAIPDGPLQKPANAARRKELNLDFTHVQPTTLAYQLYLEARWQIEAENERPAICTVQGAVT